MRYANDDEVWQIMKIAAKKEEAERKRERRRIFHLGRQSFKLSKYETKFIKVVWVRCGRWKRGSGREGGYTDYSLDWLLA